MSARLRGLVAIGCLLALLTGACADGGATGSQASGTSARGGGAGDASSKGTKAAKGPTGSGANGIASEADAGGTKAPGTKSSTTGSSGGEDDALDALASGSAETTDGASDRTGTGPGYGEITGASIEGHGDVVTFTVEVAEALPKKLPKESNLIVGIGLQEDPDHGAVAVIAQGTAGGWTTMVQDEEGSRPAPDWSVTGRTITWTIPWEWLGGPRAFEWGASLQIFDFSTEAGTATDKAPNAGPESFPHA